VAFTETAELASIQGTREQDGPRAMNPNTCPTLVSDRHISRPFPPIAPSPFLPCHRHPLGTATIASPRARRGVAREDSKTWSNRSSTGGWHTRARGAHDKSMKRRQKCQP